MNLKEKQNQPRNWWRSLRPILIHSVQTQKEEVGRAGEMEGLWAQACSISLKTPPTSKCTGRAARGDWPQGTNEGSVHAHLGCAAPRRKPSCSALIPSASFTFWRIEKSELEIKILNLIWLHPRFMAAAFKDNWKQNPTAEFLFVPFLVIQYFINVASIYNLQMKQPLSLLCSNEGLSQQWLYLTTLICNIPFSNSCEAYILFTIHLPKVIIMKDPCLCGFQSIELWFKC